MKNTIKFAPIPLGEYDKALGLLADAHQELHEANVLGTQGKFIEARLKTLRAEILLDRVSKVFAKFGPSEAEPFEANCAIGLVKQELAKAREAIGSAQLVIDVQGSVWNPWGKRSA